MVISATKAQGAERIEFILFLFDVTLSPMRYDLCVMLRIGIKYCGGCNPSYDRVEVVHRAQSRLNRQLLFVRHDQLDVDVMILISGCQRACAAEDLNRTGPHYSITGENDIEALMFWLKSLTAEGDG